MVFTRARTGATYKLAGLEILIRKTPGFFTVLVRLGRIVARLPKALGQW